MRLIAQILIVCGVAVMVGSSIAGCGEDSKKKDSKKPINKVLRKKDTTTSSTDSSDSSPDSSSSSDDSENSGDSEDSDESNTDDRRRGGRGDGTDGAAEPTNLIAVPGVNDQVSAATVQRLHQRLHQSLGWTAQQGRIPRETARSQLQTLITDRLNAETGMLGGRFGSPISGDLSSVLDRVSAELENFKLHTPANFGAQVVNPNIVKALNVVQSAKDAVATEFGASNILGGNRRDSVLHGSAQAGEISSDIGMFSPDTIVSTAQAVIDAALSAESKAGVKIVRDFMIKLQRLQKLTAGAASAVAQAASQLPAHFADTAAARQSISASHVEIAALGNFYSHAQKSMAGSLDDVRAAVQILSNLHEQY